MTTIFTFQYNIVPSSYQMKPNEIATPQMDINATAIADWWGSPVTDFNGPALCEFWAGDLSQKCQLQLFDAGGQPILGNRAPFVAGSWSGKIAFRPLNASMIGGNRLDISVKFTAQDEPHLGQGGGTGTMVQVFLANPAPVPKHRWEFKNAGVALFVQEIPEGQENVSLWRDGKQMYPNFTGGPQ